MAKKSKRSETVDDTALDTAAQRLVAMRGWSVAQALAFIKDLSPAVITRIGAAKSQADLNKAVSESDKKVANRENARAAEKQKKLRNTK